MKHLKLFEAYDDIEIIKKEIDDILQELSDRGFTHAYQSPVSRDILINIKDSNLQDPRILYYIKLNVILYKLTDKPAEPFAGFAGAVYSPFIFSDIEDDIYHLLSYMESIGKNLLSVVACDTIYSYEVFNGSLDFNSLKKKFEDFQEAKTSILYVHFLF